MAMAGLQNVAIYGRFRSSPAEVLGPELCRVSDTGPLMIYPPVLMAGVRKPSGKEPAGARRAACGLWGFDGAASSARVALAGAFDGGSTIAVESFWPLPPSLR